MPGHFDCIVLGAGMAGVTAACELKKQGKKVLLLPPAQFTTAAGNTCRAGILPGTFFGDHSNVMAITVRAGEVLCDVHRTRKAAAPEKTGRVLLVCRSACRGSPGSGGERRRSGNGPWQAGLTCSPIARIIGTCFSLPPGG